MIEILPDVRGSRLWVTLTRGRKAERELDAVGLNLESGIPFLYGY